MLAQRIVQVLAALHVLHRSVLAPTESMCARADGVEDGKIGAVGRGRRRGRVAGCLDAARSHRAVRAGADGHKTGGHAGQRERKRVQAASRRGAKSRHSRAAGHVGHRLAEHPDVAGHASRVQWFLPVGHRGVIAGLGRRIHEAVNGVRRADSTMRCQG